MNRSRLSDSQGRRHLGLRIKMTSVRTSFLADRCLNARDSHQPPSITRHAKPNRNPPANHQPNHRCLEKWQSAPVAKAVGFSPQRGISHKRRLEAVLQRHQSDAAAPIAEKHNFHTKWWGTYRQWEQLGGNVMRRPEEVEAGHWGTAVILWRPVEKTEVDPDTGEESTKTFGFLKQYHLLIWTRSKASVWIACVSRTPWSKTNSSILSQRIRQSEPLRGYSLGGDPSSPSSPRWRRRFHPVTARGESRAEGVLRHGAA